MLAASAGPGLQYAAVVAEHHQREQPLAEELAACVAASRRVRAPRSRFPCQAPAPNSNPNDDFAELLVRFQVAMCLNNLVELKGSGDDRL